MLIININHLQDNRFVYRCPDEHTPSTYLCKLCFDAFEMQYGEENRGVKKRLKDELNIIYSRKLESFFLLLWDIAEYAKKHKIIMGPGRGALPGSIVSYLLGITKVDPIKYNLLYERLFFQIDNDSLEVWIDFDNEKEYLLLNYIQKKYGLEEFQISVEMDYQDDCIAKTPELSVISSAITGINHANEQCIDIDRMDFADEEVFNTINCGNLDNYSFLPNWESREVFGKIEVHSIEDMAVLLHLGPESENLWSRRKMLDQYVLAQNDKDSFFIENDIYNRIMQNTHGVLIFHEQIIEVFRLIGGFSRSQSCEARRLLCKRELAGLKAKFLYGCEEEFIDGSIKKGVPENIGAEIYSRLEQMAVYTGNKSHLIAYAILVYQLMWLKTYYPKEYSSAYEAYNGLTVKL